jgi:hypothetical protein
MPHPGDALWISFVSYLERVNISIAAELMMPTLFLTKMQMGHIFSSFLIGYAIFRDWATSKDRDSPSPQLACFGGIATVFTGLIPGFVKDTTAVFLYAAARADSRTVASLRYASVWDRFSLPKPAFGLQPSISLANIRALFRAS